MISCHLPQTPLMHFLSSLPSRCQPFCGDLQYDKATSLWLGGSHAAGGGGKSKDAYYLETKRKVKGEREEGYWRYKWELQLVLPCLYFISNLKAEPQIQSQMWGDFSEHNGSMALFLQQLVLPLPPRTHTHCLNQSLSFLPGTLHLVSSNKRKVCYFLLGFFIDNVRPQEVTLSISIPLPPPYLYPFISSRVPPEVFLNSLV